MLEAATFVNQIFRNFGWNDSVKSFFCIVGTSWMGWGRVEWYWHTGMSYLTSLNTQLFKNIAYVGSFGHILFNLIFNVNSNLAESSANCSALFSICLLWFQKVMIISSSPKVWPVNWLGLFVRACRLDFSTTFPPAPIYSTIILPIQLHPCD